jgi:hypothetical protein
LWRDRVAVFLGPRRVQLARETRGLRARPGLALSVSCGEGTGAAPALEALGRALGKLEWKNADVDVTLSNHFVRLALVPGAAQAKGREERLAMARHALREVYGERAEDWRIALGPTGGKGPFVAAAMDADLLDRLTETLQAASLTPRSVQPFLVAAFNGCARSMSGSPAWLAAAESGRVCIAYFNGGEWKALRSQRLRGSLREELPAILEQTRLAESAVAGEVYLVSREEPPFDMPKDGPWSVRAAPLPVAEAIA